MTRNTYKKLNTKKLRENSLNTNFIEVVVNVFPDWKLAYILKFLKVNKKLEDFKKIHLFSSLRFWSESEIPLIMEKFSQTIEG